MVIEGITDADLAQLVAAVGLRADRVRRIDTKTAPRVRFHLARGVGHARYQRTSYDGRRINAVCFHGYRAFFDALFAAFPTAKAWGGYYFEFRYDGVDDYHARFDALGDTVLGAYNRTMLYREACNCDDA